MKKDVQHTARSKTLQNYFLLVISSALVSTGCQKSENSGDSKFMAAGLRGLSKVERAQDFDQMFAAFKNYYGPYEYKEKVLKINLEQEANRLKNLAVNASSDEEFVGYLMQFAAQLRDGHVGLKISNSATGISAYKIPIFIELIENRALVGDIEEGLSNVTGIAKGDEIVEVDGQTPLSYMPTIKKYAGLATEKSEKLFIFRVFIRPSYMTDLLPKSTTVNVKFKKTDTGSIQSLDIPWVITKYNADLDKMLKPKTSLIDARFPEADEINSIVSNATQMGATNPFFVTNQAIGKYQFIKLYPSPESLKKAGLKENEKPPIYSALYRYKNKNILLVRNATYSPSDFDSEVYMKAYNAILTEFQGIADILVLDQTHNPGGSYCANFYELFANAGDRQAVQKCNADRKWINTLGIEWPQIVQAFGLTWDARNSEAMAMTVEKAYDAGIRLSEAIPLFTGQHTVDNKIAVWKKPMILLVDELAGSCGDIFPMLIKSNKRAKLFGQQTMGLGGNVEPIVTLNDSRVEIRLTRGLFTTYKASGDYSDSDFVENNGVMPDKEYTHTVSDSRAGYVEYIKAFSDFAIEELGNVK